MKNIQSKIEINKTKAFYLPGGNESLKSYVEVQKLKNEKFDDASWENDIECPREFQEFSDDEQETSFKNEKKRKKLKKREVKKDASLVIPEKYSKIRELSKNSRNPEVPKIKSVTEKPVQPTPDIDIEKLAEQQLQMIAEMEQSKKEESSYKNFFFNDQKVYSKSTSGLPGSCNYISKGQTVRLFQCQVKNHFATENNFSKFEIFSKKKCIIHLVELDELFPKIWVRDLKTACGRRGAHAKCENNANCFSDLPVT